jgi:hypothetical protein
VYATWVAGVRGEAPRWQKLVKLGTCPLCHSQVDLKTTCLEALGQVGRHQGLAISARNQQGTLQAGMHGGGRQAAGFAGCMYTCFLLRSQGPCVKGAGVIRPTGCYTWSPDNLFPPAIAIPG